MPEHTPAPTPSRSVYGFALYLSFKLFFILYIIWAFVPEQVFEFIGITFLPQQYWAVAVPLLVLTVLSTFAIIIYPSMGLLMTPDMDDLRTLKDKVGEKRKLNGHQLTVVDSCNKDCSCSNKETCYKEFYDSIDRVSVDKGIPPIRDLDMWDVSEHLFSK